MENTLQLPVVRFYSLLNKDGIFGVSNIQGKDELCMHNFGAENPRDLGIDGRIILRFMLN